jgi:hypothetical protein
MKGFVICRPYSSSNIIRIIKQRRVRWAGNVAYMGKMRNAYRGEMGRECSIHGKDEECIQGFDG